MKSDLNLGRVEIEHDGAITRVWLDGKEIKDITAIDVRFRPAELPTVNIEVVATNGCIKLKESETSIEAHVVDLGRP